MVYEIFKILNRLPALRTFSRLSRRIFGVNIAILSADGKEGKRLGAPKYYNSFCTALQRSKRLKQACLQCDQKHFQKARRLKKSIKYTCHMGLTDFVIPILDRSVATCDRFAKKFATVPAAGRPAILAGGPAALVDREIAALMQCGQVLSRQPTKKQWNLIRAKIGQERLDMAALERLFYRTRVVAPKTQRDLIQLLEIFANYTAFVSQRLLQLEKTADSQAVLLAKAYIKKHLQENLKLDVVARAACSSTRNLTRVFRAETGMTILGYIYWLRIEAACRQLLTTREKILQVALETGFNNVQHFNRIFKRLKKCAPSAWRRKQGP